MGLPWRRREFRCSPGSFPFYCFPLFLCIDHWGRLSYLFLLFFGALHSNGCIFPFLLCLLLHGPLEKGMANHFSILALRTPWRVWKGKKIGHWKMNSLGAQYATGDQWRNSSRKNEETEPKQKHPVVDETGDGSKVWFCKEQYFIGTWNVRSMNQGI